MKTTAKFRASRRLRFADTKRIMSPEMSPKSFGPFEKQAPGVELSEKKKRGPFIQKATKISWCEQSINSNYRFTCISANVIHCISYAHYAKKSLPVERHFNLTNHSTHNITICGLSLHQGNIGSRKNLEQKSFNSVFLTPKESKNASPSINLFISPSFHQWHCSSTPSITHATHNPSIRSDEGLMLEESPTLSFHFGNLTLTDDIHKWLPIHYSFVVVQISLPSHIIMC